MAKSFWLKEQKGDFSNDKNDTFDPNERCIGIRLQQGVPLLDSDWNELEDIRRYQEWVLRKYYIGNGSPDGGFQLTKTSDSLDFMISPGRYMVDGLEAVNIIAESQESWKPTEAKAKYERYSDQSKNDPSMISLNSLVNGDYVAYLDIWIDEGKLYQKNIDIKDIITCIRQKTDWRVRIGKKDQIKDGDGHHQAVLASFQWEGGKINGDIRNESKNNSLKALNSKIDELETKLNKLISAVKEGGITVPKDLG